MRTLLATIALLGLTTNFCDAAKSCKAPKRKKCCCACVVVTSASPAATAPAEAPKAAYDEPAAPPAPATEKAK